MTVKPVDSVRPESLSISLLWRCNVRVHEPCAVGLEIDIGIANVGFAFPEGLDLRAVKHQAGLMFLKNMVVIGCGAVLRDDVLARLGGLLCIFRGFSHNLPS